MEEQSGDRDEEVYDFVPETPKPVVRRHGPVVNRPGEVLSYRTAPPSEAGKTDPQAVRDLYLPLWLLGGSIVVEVGASLFRAQDVRLALIGVGVQMILGTALMLVGVLVAVRFRGIEMGTWGPALLKLAAISIAPTAAVTLFDPILSHIPLGWLLGLIAEFIFYFALLGALFDLDQSDTWYLVMVIFIIRVAVFFAILSFILRH